MTREETIAYFKKNAIRIKGIMAEEDEALKDRFSQTLEATDMAIEALELVTSYEGTINKLTEVLNQQKEDEWTIKQYQVPIENKQIPTISGTVLSREPTACKIVCTYTHSACKSDEYLNKYKYCPNCGAKMRGEEE